MHLLIELDYCADKFEKMTDEEYTEMRLAFVGLPVERPKYFYQPLLLTDENKHLIAKYGFGFHLCKAEEAGGKALGQMLVKLQDQIAKLELKTDNLASLESKGAAVQIHVPDFCLMQITEVEVLDDCCTDVLQQYLSEGWRILAVCPPNAQRRPDYVLGRRKVSD